MNGYLGYYKPNGVKVTQIVEDPSDLRLVYEPDNPDANTIDGVVFFKDAPADGKTEFVGRIPYEECFEKNRFVADFQELSETAKILDIDEAYFSEWYDKYFDVLFEFAEENGLQKHTYKNDLFYGNTNSIIEYIMNNYYSADGDQLDFDYVVQNLIVYKNIED